MKGSSFFHSECIIYSRFTSNMVIYKARKRRVVRFFTDIFHGTRQFVSVRILYAKY